MQAILAFSKAGHDKGRLYAVMAEKDGFVWLADGRTKTAQSPKKKNIRHIQPVYDVSPEVTRLLSPEHPDRDVAIRRAIDLFLKDN